MAWFKTSLVTCYFSPPPQHGIGKQGTYQQMKMQGIQRPFHHSNKKTNSKEGHDWLKLGLNWTHQMPNLHTWHKDYNRVNIALVGPVALTPQNHTWTHLFSMQFWSMHAHTQALEGYMEAWEWAQHHTKNSSSLEMHHSWNSLHALKVDTLQKPTLLEKT